MAAPGIASALARGAFPMSEMIGHFHFLRPWWLLALLLLPVIWRLLRERGTAVDVWRGAVDAHLLEHLLIRGDDSGPRSAPNALIAVAWVVACLALSGPAWEQLPQPLFQNRAARVIALELGPSMRAEDVKPSRVERARFKIADILKRSSDAQTALIAYAGDAFVVAPLTDDSNTVANLLEALDPSVMPVAGNDTGRAIDEGVKLIQQAGMKDGEIIIVADAPSSNANAAAARARAAGMQVSALGIGTALGSPVATTGGGFLKDESGRIVMPRLQAGALAAVAAAGGGRYASYTADAQDLNSMLDDLRPSQASEAVQVQAQSARFIDRGPWLLLILLPLAACSFRRGWLMLLPLLIFAHPQRAQAFSWTDLWQRPDQQAQALLDQGDAKRAQAIARDPDLLGTAAYRAEDFAQASTAFNAHGDKASADAQYNLGNALAREKKYPQAIAAYDKALAQSPGMQDAIANKKAIEDLLKQQQDKSGDDKSGKGDDKQNQDGQGQPGQDQNSKSGQDGKGQQSQNGQPDSGKDGNSQQAQDSDGKDQSGDDQQKQADGKDGKSDASKPGQSAQEKSDQEKAKSQGGDQQADAAADSKASAATAKEADAKAQQNFQKGMDQALKAGEKDEKAPQPVRLGATEDGPHDEKQAAVEQWLRRVPDDPGGLLRRKFQLENERRHNGRPPTDDNR